MTQAESDLIFARETIAGIESRTRAIQPWYQACFAFADEMTRHLIFSQLTEILCPDGNTKERCDVVQTFLTPEK